MLILPFFAVTGILLALLSYTVFSIEKDVIIRNWDKRRCDIPVLFGASYFKPSNDPRSSSQFANDNFTFCMKRRVSEIMELIMAPFIVLLGGQMNVTGSIGNGLQILRNIVSRIYKAFYSFLEPFYRRFVFTAYQVMAITQRLKMAYQRINTIVLAFIFSGLTIIRGMLNLKDFIIKVVLIILGIMVAMIIILFFVLAPFIGTVIIPVIAVISAAVGGAAVGGMADAFCFAPETLIELENGSHEQLSKLRLGMRVKDGGEIKAILRMTANDVKLWNIDGNIVSSHHIVKDDIQNTWVFAKNHCRAKKIDSHNYNELICLTTQNRIFKTSTGLIARDWEELSDTDKVGNMYYEQIIKSLLNFKGSYSYQEKHEKKDSTYLQDYKPTLSNDFYKVQFKKGQDGLIPLHNKVNLFSIGDMIYDSKDTVTQIIGFAETNYEYCWKQNGVYSMFSKYYFPDPIVCMIPITESGKIAIFDNSGRFCTLIMDFTEVGSGDLPKTYDFILSQLSLE